MAALAADASRLRGMRVLVTGASGLVGRRLGAALREAGALAIGFDRVASPDASAWNGGFHLGDLRDAPRCERACRRVDAVVHSAAVQYHSDPPRFGADVFFAQNAVATRALARAAAESRVARLIFLSSDMVYGVPKSMPVREDAPKRPAGPYGRSKLAAEAACEAARARGVSVAIFRPRLIVGAGRLGVLRALFDRVRSGGRVPMIGAGRNRYQMIAVDDVATACLLALVNPVEGAFNLGSSDPPSVRELLTDLCARAGTRARVVALPGALVRGGLRVLSVFGASPLRPEQFVLAEADCVLDTRRTEQAFGWRARHGDAAMLWEAYRAYTCAAPSVVVAQVAPADREAATAHPKPDCTSVAVD